MGLLLLFNGGFMALAALISGLYADGATLGISLAAITTLFVGTLAMYFTRGHKKEVKSRRSEKETLESVLTMKCQDTRKALTNELHRVEDDNDALTTNLRNVGVPNQTAPSPSTATPVPPEAMVGPNVLVVGSNERSVEPK